MVGTHWDLGGPGHAEDSEVTASALIKFQVARGG